MTKAIEWRTGSEAESVAAMTLDEGIFEVKLGRVAATLEFRLEGALAFALFDSGVLQSGPHNRKERKFTNRLERFYAVRRGAGCVSVDLRDAHPVTSSIVHTETW